MANASTEAPKNKRAAVTDQNKNNSNANRISRVNAANPIITHSNRSSVYHPRSQTQQKVESELQNDSKNWIRFYGTTMKPKQATRKRPQHEHVYLFCAFTLPQKGKEQKQKSKSKIEIEALIQPLKRNFKFANKIQCEWHILDHQNQNIIPESQQQTKKKIETLKHKESGRKSGIEQCNRTW